MRFQKITGRLVDVIFGYDFFVSYTWADGSKYADSLYKKLTAQGFTVFLDKKDYARGDNWTLLGRRALKKTRQLILVATPKVHESGPVLKELKAFQSPGRRIIPIEIGDALDPRKYPDSPLLHAESPLLPLIPTDLLKINQPLQGGAIPAEAPPEVIRELRRGFQHVRQAQKRIRFLLGACVVLLGVSSIAVWQAFSANQQRKVANRQKAEAVKQEAKAKEQTQVANHARADAVEAAQQTRLRASKADADIALQLAGRGDKAYAFAHVVRSLELNPKNTIASIVAYRLLGDGPLTLPSHLLTHSSIVRALTFSPDGRMVATGCDDGSVAVADLETNERFTLSDKSPASVVKLAFSPDGQSLAFATGSEAGQRPAVRIWEYRTRQKPVLVSEDCTVGILELAWPLKNRIVAHSGRDWGSGDRLTQVFGLTEKRWEAVFGVSDRIMDEKARPHVVESHSFQTWVAEEIAALVIHERSKHRLSWFDLHGTPNINKPFFTVKTIPGDIVEVAQQGGVAVIGTNFTEREEWRRDRENDPQRQSVQSVLKWADPRLRAQGSIKLPKDTTFDQISANGERLLALKPNGAVILDRHNGKELASLAIETSDPYDLLALSKDGNCFVVRSESNGATLAELGKEEGISKRGVSVPARVTSAGLDPSGRWLALQSDDKNVRIWSRGALRQRPLSLSGAAPKDPSSNQTVTDSSHGTSGANYELTENDEERLDIYRMNPETKQRMHVSTLQKIEEAQEAMTGHSFSPDGSRIAVTYGSLSDRPDNNAPSVAVLFDTATGRMIGHPLHHDDDVFSPCYSPNGKWFVTVSDDRTVRRWDGQSGAPIGEPLRLPFPQRFAQVSPDSELIITGTADVIDAAKWQVIKKLAPPPVRVFARSFFSPDGLWLATISEAWEPTDESPSFIEVSQWDLQNAVLISGPIEVSLGRKLPETGYPASWLGSGRSLVIGPDLAWQCTLPCAVESILPFLRACRPLILGETGEQTVNNNCSLESMNLKSFFSQGRTMQNQTAYDLAERVLKRSGTGLQNSERLSP
jgi:WD40 repeat protein